MPPIVTGNKIWGKLVRTGGSEAKHSVPDQLILTDPHTFFGRFGRPAPKPDQTFQHETQSVISCLYVSSTHFSIQLEATSSDVVDAPSNSSSRNVSPTKAKKNKTKEMKESKQHHVPMDINQEPAPSFTYRIYDYSRNGTFLNNELIGSTSKVLQSGDEISLKYKDMVKVTYRFDPVPFDYVDDLHAKQEPDSKAVANGSTGVSSKDRDIDSLALKKADSMTEIFTHQIVSLQSDVKKLENQLSQKHESYDLLQSENDKLSRKSRQDEKLIASHANEIAELKERIATVESEKSAIQARNQILSDTVDDLKQEVKETKQKNMFFQEELSNKSQQLNSVRSLIEENNKVLATEKKQRHLHEQQISECKHNLTMYEEKNLRLTTANQALQEIVSDLEHQTMTLQVSLISAISD
jgi:hypothetical protein